MSGSKEAASAASDAVMQTMREQQMENGDGESAPPPSSRQSARGGGGGEPASATPTNSAENRRNWQAVLRECQKVDASRTGLVYRETFLDAVAKSGLTTTLGAQSLSEISDQFMVKDGQVDYLSCFRTYLNGAVSKVQRSFILNPTPLHRTCHCTGPYMNRIPILT